MSSPTQDYSIILSRFGPRDKTLTSQIEQRHFFTTTRIGFREFNKQKKTQSSKNVMALGSGQGYGKTAAGTASRRTVGQMRQSGKGDEMTRTQDRAWEEGERKECMSAPNWRRHWTRRRGRSALQCPAVPRVPRVPGRERIQGGRVVFRFAPHRKVEASEQQSPMAQGRIEVYPEIRGENGTNGTGRALWKKSSWRQHGRHAEGGPARWTGTRTEHRDSSRPAPTAGDTETCQDTAIEEQVQAATT